MIFTDRKLIFKILYMKKKKTFKKGPSEVKELKD